MSRTAWINQSQPQTLVIATILLYFNAVFGLVGLGQVARVAFHPNITGLLLAAMTLLTVVGGVFAGRGLAAERWTGFYLAMAVALAPFVFRVLLTGSLMGVLAAGSIFSLIAQVALVILLLHPQSRDYAKLWFRK